MTRPVDPRAPAAAVPITSLSRGATFTAADGGHFTHERVDGVSRGVIHAVDRNGARTTFAGCADVVPGWHPIGWLGGRR